MKELNVLLVSSDDQMKVDPKGNREMLHFINKEDKPHFRKNTRKRAIGSDTEKAVTRPASHERDVRQG